jgi:hypothetical protein
MQSIIESEPMGRYLHAILQPSRYGLKDNFRLHNDLYFDQLFNRSKRIISLNHWKF